MVGLPVGAPGPNVEPGISLTPAVAAGGIAKKKKKKGRVRGEKPRQRVVLRQDDRPAEVNLGRGRTRELDVAPKRSSENAMPRRMRALLAAKASLEAKAKATASVPQFIPVKAVKAAGSTGAAAKPATQENRKTTRQIVIETVRRNSRQHEKKKAFHAKREERAAAKKEKRKHRRRRSNADDYEISDDDVVAGSAQSGFTSQAQAQAPPRLDAVVKRHK
jgi:hypothetical protein